MSHSHMCHIYLLLVCGVHCIVGNVADRRDKQWDQMARLFFNMWLFSALKFCPIVQIKIVKHIMKLLC